MTKQWKSIRIFISSTFKDMHAERDHLIQFVFPELKEKCRKHRVNLTDVDLRWGVSEKDAQDGKTLDICLDEIDSCRPFFLGLLGHRYGWVPLSGSIKESYIEKIDRNSNEFKLFLEAYRKDPSTDVFMLKNDDDLRTLWGKNEEKNRQSLIKILKTIEVPNAGQSITAREIYHGVLHNDIPEQIVDLKAIIHGKFENHTLDNKQIDCLKNCYQWDGRKEKYLLINNPNTKELEIIRSLFKTHSIYQRDRSFFFLRSESLTTQLAGSKISDFFETEDEYKYELEILKEKIATQKLFTMEYDDIETFGKKVGDILWERIESELNQPEKEEKSWLEEETELHELFMADRTRRFVGRDVLLKKMQSFCEQEDKESVLVITGEPGCGKSALMSRFTEEIIQRHPDWLTIPHFIGASPSSTNLRQSLRRFCTTLNNKIGSPKEIPEEIKELLELFPDLLSKATQQNKIIIVLDAVNQFETSDNAYSMQWLPDDLSKNVKIVVSTLAGETHDALLARRDTPTVEQVHGLNESEIKELVHTYLQEIKHEFPDSQIASNFFSKIKTGNPLYILVALEELRIFGQFEALADRISQLPDEMPALFNQVLERVESAFNPALVRDCMSYIACGRQGMTAEELQTLLADHAPPTDTQQSPDKLPDMIWARLYCAFAPYLFKRSGVVDFFHSQLKEAVGRRYLPAETERKKYHEIIGDYFEKRWREPYLRAIDELPHQRNKVGELKAISRILMDLEFMEAKCVTNMIRELVNDYQVACNVFAGLSNERKKMDEFKLFFQSQIHILAQYPELTFQQAMNQPDGSSPFESAISLLNSKINHSPWFEWLNKPQYKSPCTMTLAEFNDPVKSCSYSPDGCHIVSASFFGLQIWDVKTGAKINELKGHTDFIKFCTYSPDGNYIASASEDNSMKIWDSKTGDEVISLLGHSGCVNYCVYSPEGGRLVSTSDDHTVKIWDALTGDELVTLTGHNSPVTSCSYSPDGNCIISTSSGEQNTLIVWNAQSGKFITSMSSTLSSKGISCCDYAPDGNKIVLALNTRYIEVWDMVTRSVLSCSTGHKREITSSKYSHDGNHIITSSKDKTIKIWNAKKLTEVAILHGHSGDVNFCSYSPDDSYIVSASFDQTLKVWDAKVCTTIVPTSNDHSREVLSCAYSPDGLKLTSSSFDNTLKTWNLKEGEQISTLIGHTGPVNFCKYSPNGNQIISTSWDCTLKIWDAKSNKEMYSLTGHNGVKVCCAYSPDGKHIISSSEDNSIRIWDAQTGMKVFSLVGHDAGVSTCTYSPSGDRVLSSSDDKTLKVWDVQNGRELATMHGHSETINICVYSPDGKRIISSSNDGTIKLWNAVNGKFIATIRDKLSLGLSCTYSPCGRNILYTHSSGMPNSGKLKILSTKGYANNTILSGRHLEWIKSCAYFPDGRFVISSSSDNSVRIWDAQNGTEIVKFIANEDITSVDFFMPDQIVIGGMIGTVYLLTVKNIISSAPVITPVKIFDSLNNKWQRKFSSWCKWCGAKFTSESKIIDAIVSMNSHLSFEQSPCHELPLESWNEPILKSKCPHCFKPLLYNPFLVDNYGSR